jgi:hypothetical protein
MATDIRIRDIIADEKVEKVWLDVELYWLGDDCTTTVPSKEPCIVLEHENHEHMRAILSAQYRGGVGGDLAEIVSLRTLLAQEGVLISGLVLRAGLLTGLKLGIGLPAGLELEVELLHGLGLGLGVVKWVVRSFKLDDEIDAG